MKPVKIAELKNRRSRGDAERVDRLEGQGVIRPGTGHLDRKWLREKPVRERVRIVDGAVSMDGEAR